MADAKLTALTAHTTVTDDDVLYVVDDPAGTPAGKKITAANLKAYVNPNTSYNNIFITCNGLDSCGQDMSAIGVGIATLTWPVANTALYLPFCVQQAMTAVKMAIVNVTTGTSNIDVGIYDVAGTRLVSTGSTTHTGNSALQSFDIADTALAVGQYYFGIAIDNNTATIRGFSSASPVGYYSAMGVLMQASALPLPSTATFVATTAIGLPGVSLSGRTLV